MLSKELWSVPLKTEIFVGTQKFARCTTKNIKSKEPKIPIEREYQDEFAAPLFTAYFTGRALLFFNVSLNAKNMCNSKPINKPTSIMRITMLCDIKCAAILKVAPWSLRKMHELMPTCTTKNEIRKMPVIPIRSLRPSVESRMFALLITVKLLDCNTLQIYDSWGITQTLIMSSF